MSAADIASAASATDEKLRRDKLVTENLGLYICVQIVSGAEEWNMRSFTAQAVVVW